MRISATLAFLLAITMNGSVKAENTPRIVNIVNFIRQVEPRDSAISEQVLFETVHHQVDQLNQYQLAGTFLLQYDALINPYYQNLLKNELNKQSEVGAWWEITQPQVEAAGLKWRGRYAWDWHTNVGFSTGYTPQEREKLVDVYMSKFKSIFGKYPATVGSWFIDAYSLNYMYEKYGIVASCNCKDQYGTDGYTMWGGYWNQAYYPSKKNAYMPAQNAESQIPVPIFRMLGSDPIYQYDQGMGSSIQGVISLEPVYPQAGGSEKWVNWFFKSMFEDPSLGFNYVQAGQENSFTWDAMKKGLDIQIPILAQLNKDQKIRVETLETSGKWFKKNYAVTPATSLSALTDVRNEGRKTLWFNSRYYRVNLLWKDREFRFRDIHLFNENLESMYLHQAGTSTQCLYTTLPLVDGLLWSTADHLAGLRVMSVSKSGVRTEVLLDSPVISNLSNQVLQVVCKSGNDKSFKIVFYEDHFEMSCDTPNKNFQWVLELTTAPKAKLPVTSISKHSIKATEEGFNYQIVCKQGAFVKTQGASNNTFQIVPSKNKLIIDLNTK